MKNVFLLFVTLIGIVTIKVSADETVRQEITKAIREAKDNKCELVDGKTECAAKKVEHSLQNGIENAEDAVD